MLSMVYKKYFVFVFSLFFIFIGVFVIWADTNGVWHRAEDVRGGIFGSDEQNITSSIGFRFQNFVQFDDQVYLMNNTGIGTSTPRTNLEINGRWFVTEHGSSPISGVGMFGSYNPIISRGIIQVYNYDLGIKNDLSLQGAGGNVGIGIASSDSANEKLDVNGNVSIRGVANCQGKLYTDSTGKVVCSPTVFTPVRCSAGYFISGFAENGSVICEVIFGECGSSNGTNTYLEPTTNLCSAGTWQDESNTVNTYNWKCLGVSSRTDISCYSYRKIDCVGSWADTSPTVCSLTCGGGVKQQTYAVSVLAQNGGVACPYSNGATRWGTTSCNMQPCSQTFDVSLNSRQVPTSGGWGETWITSAWTDSSENLWFSSYDHTCCSEAWSGTRNTIAANKNELISGKYINYYYYSNLYVKLDGNVLTVTRSGTDGGGTYTYTGH